MDVNQTFSQKVMQLNDIERQVSYLTVQKKELLAEMNADVSAIMQRERQARNKSLGQVSFEYEGYSVTHTIGKTVSWDQEKLNHICSTKPYVAEAMRPVTTFVPKIDERKYNSLPDEIKAEVSAARSVKPGNPSLKIKVPETEQSTSDNLDF